MPKQKFEIPPPASLKLNIVTMGGKGGTGKTTFIVSLVDWFHARKLPVRLNDLDYENKTKGGLQHYYKDAQKVNVHARDGLDVFFDSLDCEEYVVISDMGAGQGEAAMRWFTGAFDQAKEMGISFLFIGVVNNDPASVSSVLQWGKALQGRVSYLIVLNEMSDEGTTFTYWDDSPPAQDFCAAFHPKVVRFPSLSPILQGYMSDHGFTLGDVAERRTGIPTLEATRHLANAQLFRRKLFQQFDEVIPPFLPEA